MTTQIMALPLPFLTSVLALTAALLCFRLSLGASAARFYFAAFFGVVAAGSLIRGLRFGYGIEWLIAVQRGIPLFIAPLLYLGFASLSVATDAMPRIALAHLGAAVALAALTPLLGGGRFLPDMLIAGSYATYAALLLRVWRRGPNSLVLAPLENVRGISRWAGASAGFLLIDMAFDTIIAVFFARRQSGDAIALISSGAILTMVLLIGVIYGFSLRPVPRPVRPPAATPSGRDPALILAAAEEMMTREALFVDTGLTADRLAKRLHVPLRALSEALNQHRGTSVSQFVNGYRLRRAAELLASTDLEMPVIMAQSGFLTRSNFYRGFQREFGESPMAFRAKQRRKPGLEPQ